jgi:DNA-binding MarR family transcriptional regulator
VAVAATAVVWPRHRRPGSILSPAVTETGPESPTHHLPGLDEVERRCWEQFLESSTLLLEMLDRTLRDTHDLTLFDFLVLDLLTKSPNGSTRMMDLAQALVVRPSRVTEQMRRLEAHGFVRRAPSPQDGRGVITSITREGLARVKPAARTYTREIRKHYFFDQMSRQQMISLGESCRRIGDALKDSNWPRRPERR